MHASKAFGAARQYGQMGVRSEVEHASPHRLIQMLMEGALARISAARGALERGETARKGEQISMAISIVGGLRAALDHDKGGEIAENLAALYDYMERRLLAAHLRDDASGLDEVHRLLGEVKSGWDGITAAGAGAPGAGGAGVAALG